MKKKIKDLTLEEIIKFSKKYKNKCTECPLYSIKEISCMTFCELSRNKQSLIEKELDQEIEVEDDVD